MAVTPADAVERSVNSLQQVYAVVIALAIGQAAMTGLRDPSGNLVSTVGDLLPAVPGLIAFLVTIVPFFHGMNRHLDRCYLEKTGTIIHWALLFDFSIFFLEAGFLFASAWSVRSNRSVFAYLGVLLFLDMLWGWGSHMIHYRGKPSNAASWAKINLVAILVGLVVGFTSLCGPAAQPWLLMVVAFVRTVADYWFCWKFYFPQE